jgi:hypothetical protein
VRRGRLPTPALGVWHKELRRGERTRTTFDALWRAACWEQSALDAAALGFGRAAREDLRRAAEILTEAALA